MPVFIGMMMSGQNEAMVMDQACALVDSPLNDLRKLLPGYMMNFSGNSDSTFEGLYSQLSTTTDLEEAKSLTKELELYALGQHWVVGTFSTASNVAWQPYIKGYSGEGNLDQYMFARIWVDQAEKTALGR